MALLVLRRLMAAIPVLFIVALIVFSVLRLAPGDPAALVAGDNAGPEQVAAIRQSMGLDRPVLEQFARWLGKAVQGDLGDSLISSQPVSTLVADRLGPSLSLAICTIVLSVAVAIPLGVVAAWKQGRPLDRALMAGSVLGFSVPVFIIGYVLIFVFARTLHWLPVQGYQPLSEGIGAFAERLLMPTVALSFPYIALIARIVRTSVMEVMGEDFIRTARAKGAPERVVLLRHALGNAAVPIVTVIGMSVAMLIGGVVVTESVFNIPGLGRLVLESVQGRDFTVIQALILLFSVVYVFLNLAIDVLYVIVDPRIRY